MDLHQTARFVLAMNQQDPRVQANDAADRTWLHSVSVLSADEAWQAWLEFKRGNAGVPQPSDIRRLGLVVRSRREAQSRAVEAPKARRADPRPDPERWAELFAEGKRQAREGAA